MPRSNKKILGDAQPREELDVSNVVLLAISRDEDFQRPIEAAPLVIDHPAVSLMGRNIEHGEHVGREHALVRIVDGKLRADVDTAP